MNTSKQLFLFGLLIILGLFSCEEKQAPIDYEVLRIELDSIYQEDQRYRSQMQEMAQQYGFDSPQMQELMGKQFQVDQSNLKRVLEILEQTGSYPGSSLVGENAGKAVFYVLQHAPDSIQALYYEMIVGAAADGELNKRLAAMYQDRYLMNRGEPQIFGTQIMSKQVTDPETGETRDSSYYWPVADTTNIDSLRIWNGLGPWDEYLSYFGLSRWD